MRWFLFLVVMPLFGQAPVVTVTGTTPTQAVVAIQNYTGDCTLQVSESPTYAPLIPDVDPSLYAGASVDALRPDTIVRQDGTRVVTLGHQIDDRALAAATTYYLQVSGCGGTATAMLQTPTIGTGSTMQWPVPIDRSQWGNLGYPAIDLLNRKTYVDPISGLKMQPINLARHWSWRTGGGWSATSPFSQTGSLNFVDWAAGTGWTNPGQVLNGGTSTATTGGTNPVDVYIGAESPWRGYQTLDDLGILVYGSATSGASPDNQIQLCIFTNPNSGCIGTPVTVTLPTGAVTKVPSTGSDPDQVWPPSFPSPLFAGWGINGPIRVENRNTAGTLSANMGVLSIANPDQQQHFSDALEAGNRIKITGSGCAPNDVCTISAVTNAAAAQSVETITASNAPFIAYGWGVRIWKTTANGTVSVGLQYKLAGSRTIGPQAGALPCSQLPVTSGDGKKGYVCEMSSPITGIDWLYFIADDGTVRRFGMALLPQHQTQLNSWPTPDRPNGGANVPSYPVGFDATDPNVIYVAAGNNAGSQSIFELKYTGDYTQDLDYQYTAGPGGDTPDNYAPALDNMQWSNLMPPSMGMDLQSQITARFPNYNQNVYGSWSTGVNFAGISGNQAYFEKVYSGQDGGPGWIAVVALPSGMVVNLIHTADGTGTNGYMRWGALHNGTPLGSLPNTIIITNNVLNANNPNNVHSGPFQAQISGVMLNGAWNTNTALPWPPDGTYDSACPAANPYAFMEATGNQCATVRLPAGGVCNIAPATIEKQTWPCPWNASYAQPFALTPGALFGDAGGGVDDEKFRIISIAPEPDGQLRVVVQRNAIWDYCCPVGTHPHNGTSNCLGSASQAQHANGWSARMYPATLNGCASGVFVLNSSQPIAEIGRLDQGHGELAGGLTTGNLSWITGGTAKSDAPFTQLFALPTGNDVPLGTPGFAGVTLPVGTNLAQSYPARIPNTALSDPNAIPWMLDTNALNPALGLSAENAGNSIGVRTLTPIQPGVLPGIYKIQVLGTLNYKLFPLVGWAGRFALQDVSGPASNLATGPDYSVCYVFTAGECIAGSAAGEVYVRVPFAYDNGGCLAGATWTNSPCVVSGLPSGGGVRQQGIDAPDSNGRRSRFLTYLFGSPGQAYPYTGAGWLTDGKIALAPGGHVVGGWGPVGWAMQLPPWQPDSTPRNNIINIPVTVPSGSAYAEGQFGYSRYGMPGDFNCSPRSEACNTSVTGNAPFNYESEVRTPTDCANGCTIQIPAVAPNMLYYRVRHSDDGITWNNDDIQALAVP